MRFGRRENFQRFRVELNGVVVVAVHLRLIGLLKQLPSQLLLFERHFIFSVTAVVVQRADLAATIAIASSVETNAAPSDLSSSSERRPSAPFKVSIASLTIET